MRNLDWWESNDFTKPLEEDGELWKYESKFVQALYFKVLDLEHKVNMLKYDFYHDCERK